MGGAPGAERCPEERRQIAVNCQMGTAGFVFILINFVR